MSWSPRPSFWGPRLETGLENLAIASGRLAKSPGRDAGRAVERADEVRQIAEPDVERDVGDRRGAVGQEPCGTAEPGPHEILMRRDAEHAREDSEEMKRAQACLARGPIEIDRFVRMLAHPQCGLHGAAAIAGRR